MGTLFSIAALVLLLIVLRRSTKYDRRGFDRKGLHRNGTKYDDSGYDVTGYDRNGYNRQGYDANGYDCFGYNQKGYNREGRNSKGQYNRYFDIYYKKDGFCNPKKYPVIVTTHARRRMVERMRLPNPRDAEKLTLDAYCYGRSKRQVKKSSAALMEEIENRYAHSVLLIYRGYIYIFSEDNKLITVYKNDRIPL